MLDSLYSDLPLPQSGGSCSTSVSVSVSKGSSSSTAVSLDVCTVDGVVLGGDTHTPVTHSNEGVIDDVGIAAAAWSAHRSKILAPSSVRKREASSISVGTHTGVGGGGSSVVGTQEELLTATTTTTACTSSSTAMGMLSSTTTHINNTTLIPPFSTMLGMKVVKKLATGGGLNPSSTLVGNSVGGGFRPPPLGGGGTGTTTNLNFDNPLLIPSYKTTHNEYDPLKPNEYDKIVKERIHKLQLKEIEKKKQQQQLLLQQQQQEEQHFNIHEDKHTHNKQQDTFHIPNTQQQPHTKKQINLHISGEEAWQRRAQLSNQQTHTHTQHTETLNNHNVVKSEKKSVAARMMEKMGWKHGEGLGRDKQGMTGILIAKKTDKRSGVIIQGGVGVGRDLSVGNECEVSGVCSVGGLNPSSTFVSNSSRRVGGGVGGMSSPVGGILNYQQKMSITQNNNTSTTQNLPIEEEEQQQTQQQQTQQQQTQQQQHNNNNNNTQQQQQKYNNNTTTTTLSSPPQQQQQNKIFQSKNTHTTHTHQTHTQHNNKNTNNNTTHQHNNTPTRILLLTNLVGPGDVDQDLEGEIQEEASKFGNLLNVNIYEAKHLPDHESVRIFCAYESHIQANKALQAMNGRVFGGRIVKARFFDENQFNQGLLQP